MNPVWCLLGNFAATWYLVGLIWLIQIVHYPLFSQVGDPQFVEYERKHADRITPVVAIPMLIELVTAVWLCVEAPGTIDRRWMVFGLGLVIVAWLSTALIQVPCHSRLGQGFDSYVHRVLVYSNWIRTIAWTARGMLMTYVVWVILDKQS